VLWSKAWVQLHSTSGNMSTGMNISGKDIPKGL
jgi:hypothetical protein